MTTPIVTEIVAELEPVVEDDFIGPTTSAPLPRDGRHRRNPSSGD